MTEAQLQASVIELAQLLGWRVAHFRPARTEAGWRTAVAGDGKGFPDLLLTKRGYLLFAELKSARGRLSPEQEEWLADLALVGHGIGPVRALVWTPADWKSGAIENALRPPLPPPIHAQRTGTSPRERLCG